MFSTNFELKTVCESIVSLPESEGPTSMLDMCEHKLSSTEMYI